MIEVRRVRSSEEDALGELTVRAYEALPGGVLGDYADQLRDVSTRAAAVEVLVAVEGDRLLGGVTYVPGPGRFAEFDDQDGAGIRMLAVDPDVQRRGVGRLLTEACIERARSAGRGRIVLHSTPWMPAAHRLYESLGFVRAPERDESYPQVDLVAFVLDLSRDRPAPPPPPAAGPGG